MNRSNRPIGRILSGLFITLCALALLGRALPLLAAEGEPWELAKGVQDNLFDAQLALLEGDTAAAEAAVVLAADSAAALDQLPPDAASLLQSALDQAATAVANGDQAALAAARGVAKGAINWGSYGIIRQSVIDGRSDVAQRWLLVREFRPSTRFSRPDADATVALRQLGAGTIGADEALAQLDADLLDTYQARLTQYVAEAADPAGLAARRAESAGIATAYWRALAPRYAEQTTEAAAAEMTTTADALLAAVLANDETATAGLATTLRATLESFRAAPLSQDDQARRAGQLLRYMALVPVEYDRGVEGTTIMVDLEIQEAVTFMAGAQAAYSDLRPALTALNPDQTAVLGLQMDQVAAHLNAANRKEAVIPAEQMKADVTAIQDGLGALLPPEWTELNADADFDVIASVLDQMEAAVKSGDYALAESARLEAYAIFDFGAEPRLLAFAPPLVAKLDGLFWQGFDGQPGLAQAIGLQATPAEIAAVRQALDAALEEAQVTLGDLPSSPASIITNAGIIVFREGLEAVVILAALTASMVGLYAKFRRPVVLGVVLAFVATAVTWWIAQEVLSQLSHFGERLEAVVSLIAIGVLLLITNWFFHKTYWKDHMTGLHDQKKQVLTAQSGQFVGLVLLGFTSIYREGFETVLFLQALTLEAGAQVVLEGVALGLLAVAVVGVLTFKLQKRLPYKTMLVWTGVLIGIVLVTMVGKTVHVMQAVGWLDITPIRGLTVPYWAGLWFGVFATWQGVVAQIGAAVFVVGSYYLAEGLQKRKREQRMAHKAAPQRTS